MTDETTPYSGRSRRGLNPATYGDEVRAGVVSCRVDMRPSLSEGPLAFRVVSLHRPGPRFGSARGNQKGCWSRLGSVSTNQSEQYR